MDANIIYLKQKCNALIDRAQEKQIVLKEKQEVLDRMKLEKATLEMQLQRIEADKKKSMSPELDSAVDDSVQFEKSNDAAKRFLPMVLVQRTFLPEIRSENRPSVMEQELFPRILEQQVKESAGENWIDDIWIEPMEEDFYTDVNYREADANSYKMAADRRQLDIPEETVIIYEHSGFYEILRKIGYLIMLLFVLLLMGCAVVAVVTTLL